ncbi:Vitamin B12 import ATP-binding protein BtuD [Methylobacterium cerastii]|uniref:Vitamin B12 import ATP-binding protein BtuD n=1 Tax=Methylobacterium cerastii TaxID=932741 RepID=A0ABQ4QCF8_9HYPH|nr:MULTISPECIES: ABC transporter ATP-binding protein [Methylobacterium]TXN02641.1 ABC transporter ATP-binding protein [Methylobacterium sp. WL103]TXN85013.1 ABC transporter ATP-binding protein [Methylobacterium sp. WL8]GJD42776.1 Vitamin B12 import ATP-binding protein BtuD [Methylobacterium cerastii]
MSAGAPTPGDIRLNCLTLGYDRHPAVHHLDGTIRRGDLLALVGPNGAGKSTLLKGLIGDIPSLDGQILRGMPARTLAYLPQADEIDRSFPLSVLDLASMGLWRRSGAWRSLLGHRGAVQRALEAVGLSGFEARPIGTLSGGQFQRALFARLILQDAQVILLDEPFTGVDARTTDDLIALIRTWHGEGRTIVAALHDLAQVRAHFPKTLLLAREPVAWGATASVLSPQNLARATRLSEAWDEDAAICAHDHAHAAAGLDAPGGGHDHAHAHEHGHGHGHHHSASTEQRETAA